MQQFNHHNTMNVPQFPNSSFDGQVLIKLEPQNDPLDKSVLLNSSQALIEGGKWAEEDSLRFVVFIQKYQDIFNSRHQRKSCKIFKIFSDYFGKRSPAQCRSHFQKLIIKYKTISKLRRFYRNKFGGQTYDNELQNLQKYTQRLNQNKNTNQKIQIGIQTDYYASNFKTHFTDMCSHVNLIRIQPNLQPFHLFYFYLQDPLCTYSFNHSLDNL